MACASRPEDMHVGIVGPIATRDIRHLLDDGGVAELPAGTDGAPLLATIVRELIARGHRVSAFTLSGGLPLRHDGHVIARGPAFELHYVPWRPRAWPFNGFRLGRIVDLYAFERKGLRSAMMSVRPDVIHAHWSYEFAWAALRTGLPHVVTCHDSPFVVARFERSVRQGLYRWLRAGIATHVLRHASRVTTVSPYMVGQVQPLCRVPVGVVPNPIGVRMREPVVRVRSDRFQVLMVINGWGPRKNGVAGLRACALLRQRLVAVELHLIGDGTEEGGPAWQQWQRQGAPGHVHFHGPVPHATVLDAMASADLLLHPALEESFGTVLTEAMAVGLPVVAGLDCGAVPWVVGDAGELVDVKSPQAMADAMAALMADPSRRAILARRGRERVASRFSVEAVVGQYEIEYESALAAVTTVRRKRTA